MNASIPTAAASQPSNFSEEEGISMKKFEYILSQPYSVTRQRNNVKFTYSGDNKHGHTLLLRNGQIYCEACNVKLPPESYKVARHIAGEAHRRLFAEGDGRAMQSENSNPNNDRMQDASDGMGKKSATRNESAPTEAAEDDDGSSENTLPVQDGLLVVNGFDVLKYIRGLEGRISKLEAMLAAANAVPSTENDVMA